MKERVESEERQAAPKQKLMLQRKRQKRVHKLNKAAKTDEATRDQVSRPGGRTRIIRYPPLGIITSDAKAVIVDKRNSERFKL